MRQQPQRRAAIRSNRKGLPTDGAVRHLPVHPVAGVAGVAGAPGPRSPSPRTRVMSRSYLASRALAGLVPALLLGCAIDRAPSADTTGGGSAPPVDGVSVGVASPDAGYVTTIGGLHDPESVRYDARQDVYFISNMVGHGSTKDGNGYVVRVSAADPTQSQVFIEGGKNGATLDAPKGLAISGDTLWVADIDVLRAFHRVSGAPLRTVDFASLGAVMLNDVAVGPGGEVRVTDTGIRMTDKGIFFVGPARVFALGPGAAIRTVASGPAIGQPNGITWDPSGRRWVVVSFDRFHWEVKALVGDSIRNLLSRDQQAKLDGVEVLPSGGILYSSWADSSLHLLDSSGDRQVIRELREPADIGIDTRRMRVAVPMPMMGRVQLWSLDTSGRVAQR